MKKILLSVVCLVMLGMQSVKAAEYTQIALQHNGNVTHFGFEQLQEAVAAAEAGDTLFLSEGSYKLTNSLTIDKPITIIGAGAANTEITNNVYVEIPNSPTLTARLLDGVRISGSLNVSCAVTGLVIRKCLITHNLNFPTTGSNEVKEMVVDRCNIMETPLTTSVGSLSVNNTVTRVIYSGYADQSAVFVNCNVTLDGSNQIGAHFLNCYITGSANNFTEFTRFSNCLAKEDFPGFTDTKATNCYTYSGDLTDTSNEYFVSQGWLGTDGTAVGMYGTATPYTLTPSGLSVKSYTLGVDTETKKLNVKMTLTSH